MASLGFGDLINSVANRAKPTAAIADPGVMTGGGAAAYLPDGSYSGSGMSGDPSSGVVGRWGGGSSQGTQNPYLGAVSTNNAYTPSGPAQMVGPNGAVSMGGGNPNAAPVSASYAQPNLGIGNTSQQPGTAAQGAQSSGGFGNNPWLQQQGQALQAMSNQNLKQNILPGIGQGAQAAGMYGSSRQGIAEGQAMANAQTGLNNALANMYSQSYGQDQQYDLGQRGLANQYSLGMGNLALGNRQADNSFSLGMGNLGLANRQAANQYDLGLRSNDLGYAGLDANINQQNFRNQLAGANFGLGIYDRMNGYNQQGTANGTQMQNTPINYFNNFNSNTNTTGGMGGSSTGTVGSSSNGAMQGLGIGSLIGQTGVGNGLSTWLNGTFNQSLNPNSSSFVGPR